MNKFSFIRVLIAPVIILAIQILLLNHVHLLGMAVPFIYIFIIMMMPYRTAPYVLMIAGFSLGLFVDIFMNTIGLNAAATSFLAFLRPTIIRIISKKDYSEISSSPSVASNGMLWFISYTLLCCLFHELFLYTLESFSFANYAQLLFRTTTGSLSSALIIIVIELLTSKKK
ncbi:MAG: rod shape-determining protein MreD [Mangrovibacterium sp.]